ncbi:acyl carrier protein [Vibrio sp. CDRSL-10 TSBA]
MTDIQHIVQREVTLILPQQGAEISEDTNLFDAGLHSLLVMRLSERLSSRCGVHIGYAALASQPTIQSWIQHIQHLSDQQ